MCRTTRRPGIVIALLFLPIVFGASSTLGSAALPGDGALQPFLGEAEFTDQQIFGDERFPNVLVAGDGTVVATWGSQVLRVRRSEDGGETWGPEIPVGAGIHGGGAIVDDRSGDLLIFGHPEHPARDGMTAPRTVYRSSDQGKTWQATEANFQADANGYGVSPE